MMDKYVWSEAELAQKSEKWKEKRLEWGLGTSEIPTILGRSPSIWGTNFDLFLRKMGKPHEFSNKYIEIGNRDEEKARKLVQNYLKNGANSDIIYDRTGGFEVKKPKFEQFTIQYKHFPQIFSSYDGIDIKNKLVLEIKSPSVNTFTKILKNRVPTVPKMYVDQTQGQLYIAESHFGITTGIFAVYYDEGVILVDKKAKTERLIKLILIRNDLDVEYCSEMFEICKKYVAMIESRCYNKNWRD